MALDVQACLCIRNLGENKLRLFSRNGHFVGGVRLFLKYTLRQRIRKSEIHIFRQLIGRQYNVFEARLVNSNFKTIRFV